MTTLTPSPPTAQWITTIPRGWEDKVAHACHRQLFRHYGANASPLPQSTIREQWAWVRSHAPSLPGIAKVLCTFLASPVPIQQIMGAPPPPKPKRKPPFRQKGRPRRKGTRPRKVDPQVFSKALWVGWQEIDDLPAGELDTGQLGGILRYKVGARLSSISDAQHNHTAKCTIVGIKRVNYDEGMKLTRQNIARG